MAIKIRPGLLARGAAILSATFAVGALAQPDQQINIDAAGRDAALKTRVVSLDGLHLADPADRRRVERLLTVAANAVCDVFDVSADRHATDFARCRADALAGARAQIAQRAAQNDTRPIAVSAG